MICRAYTIMWQRTEHAKLIRRATGTNLFTDKVWSVGDGIAPCIGTTLSRYNLVLLEYDHD